MNRDSQEDIQPPPCIAKSILPSGDKRINKGGIWCKAISPLWQPDLSRQFSFTHIWMGTLTSSHQHTVLLVVQHGLDGGHQVLIKQVPPRIQRTHERYTVSIHLTSSERRQNPTQVLDHWHKQICYNQVLITAGLGQEDSRCRKPC